MKQPPVNLRIDELSLPAIPHGGERRLREAIEREIRRGLIAPRTTPSPGKPEQRIAQRIREELRARGR